MGELSISRISQSQRFPKAVLVSSSNEDRTKKKSQEKYNVSTVYIYKKKFRGKNQK